MASKRARVCLDRGDTSVGPLEEALMSAAALGDDEAIATALRAGARPWAQRDACGAEPPMLTKQGISQR